MAPARAIQTLIGTFASDAIISDRSHQRHHRLRHVRSASNRVVSRDSGPVTMTVGDPLLALLKGRAGIDRCRVWTFFWPRIFSNWIHLNWAIEW
jgi:hypothetical protein